MPALFPDNPLVDHDDLVGVLDGRETVRDDDCGAVLHQPLQRKLDSLFRLVVERGGCLVEQQDGCIAQDRPSNRQTLLLAA